MGRGGNQRGCTRLIDFAARVSEGLRFTPASDADAVADVGRETDFTCRAAGFVAAAAEGTAMRDLGCGSRDRASGFWFSLSTDCIPQI